MLIHALPLPCTYYTVRRKTVGQVTLNNGKKKSTTQLGSRRKCRSLQIHSVHWPDESSDYMGLCVLGGDLWALWTEGRLSIYIMEQPLIELIQTAYIKQHYTDFIKIILRKVTYTHSWLDLIKHGSYAQIRPLLFLRALLYCLEIDWQHDVVFLHVFHLHH